MTRPDGPAARIARAVALRLAAQTGDHLVTEVEAALHGPPADRPGRYLDPLALAALIVASAQLAWTIYHDLRATTAHPARQVLTSRLRVELTDHPPLEPTRQDRVIELVVDETLSEGDQP